MLVLANNPPYKSRTIGKCGILALVLTNLIVILSYFKNHVNISFVAVFATNAHFRGQNTYQITILRWLQVCNKFDKIQRFALLSQIFKFI